MSSDGLDVQSTGAWPDPPSDLVEAWGRSLEDRVRRARLRVVLLGAGGRGLVERRAVAGDLRRFGILAFIPEDHFPADISPSLAEEAILATADVDLVFLKVESWGSATELGQLMGNRDVARKLRVLVPPDHHPFHGGSEGYLSDLYLTHLAASGHVYPVDGGRRVPVPSAPEVVVALSVRYRQVKAILGVFIK